MRGVRAPLELAADRQLTRMDANSRGTPTRLRCRSCGETGHVEREPSADEVIVLVCRACGARWSWVSANSCAKVPKS
jgi:hypothetical protein